MRYRTILLSILCCTATVAAAQQVNIYIGEPRASIGVNLVSYPEFVRVPNYPVYYAPRVNSNIFFYDGLYWVYHHDRWYASTWYNGPWGEVMPEAVPVYILRVPVRYYRQPPTYFARWAADAPPRWDEYWGPTWTQQRIGWNTWNRNAMPAPAPLPVYQRQYSGSRYPTRVEQQVALQSQQYRYRPRDTVVQQYYNRQGVLTTTTTSTTRVASADAAQQRQSASALAPGQLKKQQGAESAKEFAPGQVKKQQGAQSARDFAPGQVRKQQVAQAPVYVPPQEVAVDQRGPARQSGKGKGQRDRDGDGDIDANDDRGQGQGHGQGRGKGKGHGKD